MKLAIFGATGRVGSELLTQALDAGHELRVLVRNPAKLSSQRRHLTAVHGNRARRTRSARIGLAALCSQVCRRYRQTL
jgi:putative NADH-flavin reductase